MSLLTFIGLAAGLVLLLFGASILVKGAGSLAAGWGISPLIIGLTVVAYGTSAPEMAVSVAGSLSGAPDVALGNVLGSTVCNVLLILGLSALAGTLLVNSRLVHIEVPLVVVLAVLVFMLAFDGGLSRLDGLMLLLIAIGYTFFTVKAARKGNSDDALAADIDVKDLAARPWYFNLGLVAIGVAALVGGSQFLVASATDIAQAFGLSDLVIGLTVVAIGTSLPEIATSITATIKGDRDIAVGNVIGSNIFNLSAVLGLAGLVSPSGIPVAESLLRFDFPILIAVTAACLPIFFTGHKVMRWEGAVFLAYYVAYVAYLVLYASNHAGADTLASVMLVFVMPLTVITLGVLVYRELLRRKVARQSARAS